MNWLDWVVIGVYLAGLIGMGAFLGRSQGSVEDYYLAGGKVKWWQAGLSTMATQLGAISFVSAPAFVAIKDDGGLRWLAYEFGVPLAMIVVMAVIIPALHRARVISIYEYLEKRYDAGTRALVSALFQLGRGLATAVTVLAGGIIVSAALGIPTGAAILVIGVITIIYDMLGGMEGVILSDVIQMGVIIGGIVTCGLVAWDIVGWDQAWAAMGEERRKVLDFESWGLDGGSAYGFWPMTIGGFFLYMSYYGCDQSQVQRELSVGDIPGIRKSLLLNALGRFPVVLSYCVMGVLVGAVAMQPEFLERVGPFEDPDRLVPLFILHYLPHGVIGFLFVAILSALMSSLDSALNSLSAVTVQDFYRKYVRPDASDRHYLVASKVATGLWGVFCVGSAYAFLYVGEGARETTIVLINAVGSVLYGPILAVFLLGILTRTVSARGIKVGVLAGIAVNVFLWIRTEVAWSWWNVTGFFATAGVAGLVSALDRAERRWPKLRPADEGTLPWRLIYAATAGWFLALVGFAGYLETGPGEAAAGQEGPAKARITIDP